MAFFGVTGGALGFVVSGQPQLFHDRFLVHIIYGKNDQLLDIL